MDPQRIVTRLGTTSWVNISRSSVFENCHVRTPKDLQYKIMKGFNVPNVQVDDRIDCGITIFVASEDEVGTWTLISRGGTLETRLQFTIEVEGN